MEEDSRGALFDHDRHGTWRSAPRRLAWGGLVAAFRHRPTEYAAERTREGWDLRADGRTISVHRTFSKAVDAAGAHDRNRRRIRAVAATGSWWWCCAGLLLFPSLALREVDNPAYPPARAVADRMEAAYRAVDRGTADIEFFDATTTASRGAVSSCLAAEWLPTTTCWRVPRGRLLSDPLGPLRGAVRGPPVAPLRVRPRPAALNFSPSAYEAIAVNLVTGTVLSNGNRCCRIRSTWRPGSSRR